MILLIETSNILVNKLTLIIQRNVQVPEQHDIADIVKSLIFNRVCECLQTRIDWRTFIWGGAFSGKDGSVNSISASARNQEGFAIWCSLRQLQGRIDAPPPLEVLLWNPTALAGRAYTVICQMLL